MNTEKAKHLLGLSGNPSIFEVDEAYEKGRELVASRLSSTPTDALKAKYQQTLDRLDEAYEVLTTGESEPSGFADSPLSQTKMADLPGADPSFTSMGATGGVSPASMGLQSGTVLNERYDVVRLIGQGGMGAVYEARDRIKDETIAIKVLLPGLVSSDQARERFLAEAKISCKLSHPNIVNVFDVQQSGPHHFLTMELLEGQTLRERIEVQKVARSEFSVEEVQDIAKQVGDALGYAHTHMVHRDLKPENIFLCEGGTVKVMDFGIVRLLTSTELTKTGMALGTAYYMAPEQLTGAKSVDARADQYSLGVILYELLSGQLPMGAVAPIGDIRKDIPKKMAQAIMRSISPKPEERFSILADFVAGLDPGSSVRPGLGKIVLSKTGSLSLILFVVFVGIAWYALEFTLDQPLGEFVTPAEVVGGSVSTNDESIVLIGVVVPSSLRRVPDTLEIEFAVADYLDNSVDVKFQGILPDIFQEGGTIAVRGQLTSSGHLLASDVLKITKSKSPGIEKVFVVSVVFEFAGSLVEGAPVAMDGKTIGRVSRILREESTNDTSVTLSLDRRYDNIPDDSDASIYYSKSLGTEYVLIQDGGSTSYLVDGGEIFFSQSALPSLQAQLLYEFVLGLQSARLECGATQEDAIALFGEEIGIVRTDHTVESARRDRISFLRARKRIETESGASTAISSCMLAYLQQSN